MLISRRVGVKWHLALWGLQCPSPVGAACQTETNPGEVPWNWGQTPTRLDQALLLAGGAHQCLFQSTRFRTRHLTKHPRGSRLFACPSISTSFPCSHGCPWLGSIPLHTPEAGLTSLPKPMCFRMVLKQVWSHGHWLCQSLMLRPL